MPSGVGQATGAPIRLHCGKLFLPLMPSGVGHLPELKQQNRLLASVPTFDAFWRWSHLRSPICASNCSSVLNL
ncbi:hypothetical protein H6F96_19480 [Microcoleus sp. FACHB-53]|nr:hypothetical protein [Microcoleus sp. FACHB-53]